MRLRRVLERIVCRASLTIFPALTSPNISSAIASSAGRVDVYVTSVGRVTYSEPFCVSNMTSNGGTGPDALPKTTYSPRGARQSSEAGNIALPTPSLTTGTPLPPVNSLTRSTKFSRV